MAPLNTDATRLGLRERKKQQTRERIARVALELFAERGYPSMTMSTRGSKGSPCPRSRATGSASVGDRARMVFPSYSRRFAAFRTAGIAVEP